MEKIPSFKVDHLRLKRGIYVSRTDEANGETITTFDIRMKEPNREPVLEGAAMHSIEHLAATFLRNHPLWKEKVIYWGPMGCLTGCYLILKGKLQGEDILELMQETFRFISEFEGEIPGAKPEDCGNYSYQNLSQAQWEAKKYLHEVLLQMKPENFNYPDAL